MGRYHLKISKYLWFVCWLVTLTGCANDVVEKEGSKIMVIEARAGTMPADTSWNFLPYPAHFGTVDGQSTLLISKNARPGKKISVMPIAVIKFQKGQNDYQWLIANDASDKHRIQGLDSIDEMMTIHNGIKSTLERWIINQYGVGEIMLKGWNQPSS
ncbi:MAG: hypothetical protein KJP00_10240 [Bacteroidia bacterium]|nr:hypothetical protein [Bacteroidia bacterium]